MKPQEKVIDKIKANRKNFLEALRTFPGPKLQGQYFSDDRQSACVFGVWFLSGWYNDKITFEHSLGITGRQFKEIMNRNDETNATLPELADWIEKEFFK